MASVKKLTGDEVNDVGTDEGDEGGGFEQINVDVRIGGSLVDVGLNLDLDDVAWWKDEVT